jgi:spore germination protein
MKLSMLPLLIVSLLMLAGCVEKEVIDDVNIAMGLGYDLEGNEVLGTAMIPVYKAESIENFIFTAKGNISRELVFRIRHKSGQPIVTGSLEMAFFGDKLAKKGIVSFIDAFQRDPSIGARIYLAVIDGTAQDVLKGSYGNRGNADYFSGLFQHNEEQGNLPLTNIHQFLFDYYQQGQDPFLPLLKKEKDLVEITGLAVFKDQNMMEVVTADEMFYFKLINDKFSRGTVKTEIDSDEVIVRNIRSKHKMELSGRNPWEFTVHITVNGTIQEYTGKFMGPKEVEKVQKALEKQIEEESLKLMTRLQENKVDPFGFGHFAKTRTRGFDFKKWESEYPNAKFKVKANVIIKEVGIVE